LLFPAEEYRLNNAIAVLHELGTTYQTIFPSRTQICDQLLIERYEARKPAKSGISDTIGLQEIESEIASAAPRGPVVPIGPQSSGAELSRSSAVGTKSR
jgi:hypothetical protein